ncbi:MAG: HlyD family efflux transporter periplasmic adaptor subunit [Candidatus Latescibacteria bacterium]|nr:HlyD family efflux transporter periplasmic adaptor subunit [Candidatus Latescibacterota bacterium]
MRFNMPKLVLHLCGFALVALGCQSVSENFPTHQVERGDFHITATESGEIVAAGGDVISSPEIGGRLKIVYLYPEGEQVDVGDMVLQFDPGDFEREMLDDEGELQKAQAEYDKAKVQQEQQLLDLEVGLERQGTQLELAQLSVERAHYTTPLDLEIKQIELEKTERGVSEAEENLRAKKVVNRVDLDKQEQRITRRQQRYDRARDHFERTSVYATKPGLVVYRKIHQRGSGGMKKVKVGDEVWGGHPLIDLPDLSKMQVQCLIGEVDLKRLAIGQQVLIRLEAFPGPVFNGVVAEIAPMATPQPDAPDIQVFETFIDITEQDPRLKPGMSAEAEIILDSVPQVLSVPLQALFEKDGNPIVYRRDGGSFDQVEVELGPRNAIATVITGGLEAGDQVALKAPSRP